MASTLLLSAAAFLATSARALEVVTGSPCYDDCGGGSTYSTDLVCSDGDYTSTTYGQKMALCLTCESTSLAVNTSMPNGGTTDEYWFMFNMKYTLQTCVIDSSSKTTQVQACSDECSPIGPVLDTLWLSTTPYANQYDYCSIQSGSFPADAPACAACLQSQEGSVVLGNFVNIMSDACASQPLAQNGDLVSLPRALLDTVTVASTGAAKSSAASSAASSSTRGSESTEAASSSGSGSMSTAKITSTGTVTATRSSSSASSTAAAASSSSISSPSSGGLSSGAATGLGVAIGLVGAAAIGGLIFFILRRRKQRSSKLHQTPRESELPGYSGETPAPKSPEKHDHVQPRPEMLQELSGRETAYEADATPLSQSQGQSQGQPQAYEMDARRGSYGR